MLAKDPTKRADISHIEGSSWYKKMKEKLAQLDEEEAVDVKRNPNVIEKLLSYGFPIEAVKDTIDKKKLNHIHACFYLLKE